VLPFTTSGGDGQQEFLADGLVDDILTTLSRLSGLAVIARQSSFAYKGRPMDVRQIAAELGVGHVLEGSVRKAGNRVRITTQLVNAGTGTQVWAERYDRALDDIFALQDEITLRVATELQVRLTDGEQARLRYTTTTNLEAWTLWIEGLHHFRQDMTSAAQRKALQAWERARALDPGSAPLHALLGFLHLTDARFGWWDDRDTAMRKARDCVDRALALDPDNPDALRTIAGMHLARQDFEAAAAAARFAVARGGGLPDVLVFCSFVLQCCGKAADSIPLLERAMTLSPHHPANYWGQLGNGLRLAGRPAEALTAFRTYHARSPGFGLADIVLIQEQAGQLEAARCTAAELRALRPDFTVSGWQRTQFRADTQQLSCDVQSLQASGLPA
jgi:adenylate cyclase